MSKEIKNNFIRGEKYRITNDNDWKDKILFYVGQSIKSPECHYFEYDLDYFHLNKNHETAIVPVKRYTFINVSEEQAKQEKEDKIKELSKSIKENKIQLEALKKTTKEE